MSLQVLEDSKGNQTGVFIPITDWNKLKKKYKVLEEIENPKNNLLDEMREAIAEIKLIEDGKMIGKSARELLDEL